MAQSKPRSLRVSFDNFVRRQNELIDSLRIFLWNMMSVYSTDYCCKSNKKPVRQPPLRPTSISRRNKPHPPRVRYHFKVYSLLLTNLIAVSHFHFNNFASGFLLYLTKKLNLESFTITFVRSSLSGHSRKRKAPVAALLQSRNFSRVTANRSYDWSKSTIEFTISETSFRFWTIHLIFYIYGL